MVALWIGWSLTCATAGGVQAEVVRVARTEPFAGRLGRRIEETLVLRDAEGREFKVRLGAAHTRVRGPLAAFRPGDRVVVPQGDAALRDAVRRR